MPKYKKREEKVKKILIITKSIIKMNINLKEKKNWIKKIRSQKANKI